jgi:hypothetical protein
MNMSDLMRPLKLVIFAAVLSVPIPVRAGETEGQLPLLRYIFDEAGGKIENRGTLDGAELSMFGPDGAPKSLRTPAGGGVSGAKSDHALNLISPPNTAGPWAESSTALRNVPELDAFGITFWAKVRKWTAGGSVLRFVDGGSRGLNIILNTSFSLHLMVGDGSTLETYASPRDAYAFSEKEWTFFGIVWNGREGITSFYRGSLDPGAPLTLVAKVASAPHQFVPANGLLYLGNTNSKQKDRPLDGVVDDLRFYAGALSEEHMERIRLEQAR